MTHWHKGTRHASKWRERVPVPEVGRPKKPAVGKPGPLKVAAGGGKVAAQVGAERERGATVEVGRPQPQGGVAPEKGARGVMVGMELPAVRGVEVARGVGGGAVRLAQMGGDRRRRLRLLAAQRASGGVAAVSGVRLIEAGLTVQIDQTVGLKRVAVVAATLAPRINQGATVVRVDAGGTPRLIAATLAPAMGMSAAKDNSVTVVNEGTYVYRVGSGDVTPTIPGSSDANGVLLSVCWTRSFNGAPSVAGTGWSLVTAVTSATGSHGLAISAGDNTNAPTWTLGGTGAGVVLRMTGINQSAANVLDDAGTAGTGGTQANFGPVAEGATWTNSRGVAWLFGKRWDNTSDGASAPSTTDGLTWSTPLYSETSNFAVASSFAVWTGGAPTPDANYTIPATGSPASTGCQMWFPSLKIS